MLPLYLRSNLGEYPSSRQITYGWQGEGVKNTRRVVESGVPQGYVLGPLLWYLGNNLVLDAAVPDGARMTYYTDEIFIVVGAMS